MEDIRYECDHEGCGRSFETAAQLRGHRMSHSEKKSKRTSGRSERIPLGVPVTQLALKNQPKGKVVRWVNDNWSKEPGRIQRALAAGYDFIDADGQIVSTGENGNQNLGTRLSRAVGTNEDGSAITAYAMAIDKEFYDEDQATKQVEVNRIDEAIKLGKNKNALGGHGYVPDHGIDIRAET